MKIATIYFIFGIALGALYGILKDIIYIFKNHLAVQIICDFAFTIILGGTFIVLNNYFFWGKLRIYLLISLLLGIWGERKTLGKIFAKLFLLLYNKVSKWLNNFKSTRFGKILFR